MAHIGILGAGMVGSVMAWDLARSGHQVTVLDRDEAALGRARARAPQIEARVADLGSAAAIAANVAPFDVVIGALSSAIGLRTLHAVIDAKKDYVDISFMAENAWEASARAEAAGVTAVVDCGVAPGISNLVIGAALGELAPVERIEVLVGGLPIERRWPYEYKAPFAPSDVIEEYVRPSRVVEGGRIVLKEALSEPELVHFDGVGTLEAFNTDGLRSLAYTLKVPDMREKTLRYPGHIALMRVLRESGFFSEQPIETASGQVRPLDVTSKLLFADWSYGPREADLTVLRVTIDGALAGKPVRRTFEMLDRYDPEHDVRSMSRTTGFPATIVAGLVAEGAFKRPGVHPPEIVGQVPGLTARVLAGLAERGVHVHSRTAPR